MKNVSILALYTLTLITGHKASAQLNNQHKYYIDIGITGGVQHHDSYMAGVYGSAGVFFKAFDKPASLDFRAREFYITNPEQQGTLITLTYRISIIKGLFVGIGGAHGHQVPLTEFVTHTGSSIGGNNPHIMHSSGINTELGYSFNSFIKDKYVGIYPTLHIAYTHLFMPGHSMPNLTFNAGFRVGLKQWKS